MAELRIFYYGADTTWENINKNQHFHRRHTNILKALGTHPQLSRVYAVHRSVPEKLISRMWRSSGKKQKCRDIFFTTILPIRWKWASPFNRWFARILIYLQIGSPSLNEDIHWCYWPKGFLAYREINLKGKIIFDSDHNIIDDPNIPEKERPQRAQLLKTIGEKAAIVLSSSRSMLEWFRQHTSAQTALVMNGVDRSRFESIPPVTLPHPSPIIGYVGSLSKWVHFDWMERLIKDHPKWSFVIIGKPVYDDRYKRIERYANVHLLGPKPYSEVPAYIKAFDVALGLYMHHPALDVNSMKIYEYLAAGVPVVSSAYHPDLESDFGYLIHTAQSYDELVVCIEKVLQQQPDFDDKKRIDFLQRASWDIQIDEFIQSHLS